MTAAGQAAELAPRRSVWRPPTYAWILLGALALACAYKLFPERFEGKGLLLTPVAVVLGVVVLRRLWHSPPAYTFCAAIALTIFSGGWSEIGLGGLPFNRLLMVVGFLEFALRAPGTAQVPPLRVRNVHILMALASVYVLISATAAGTLTTEDGFLTLSDVFGIVPYLVFFLAPAVFAGDRERRLLLATLVGIGLYLGVTALLETLGPRGLVFPSYIIHTDMAGTGTIEASGPFQSPVALGFAVYACGIAALIAFFQWRERWSRRLALLTMLLCAFGCFASLERGVWVAAVAATVAGAVVTHAGRRWLVPGALACAVALALVLTLSSQLASSTSERANYDLSVWDRKNQTSAGLRMAVSKPLFGFGWGGYQSDSLEYFRQPSDYPMTGYAQGVTIGLPQHVTPLHNTYLAYAVELGLVGWMLWLGSLVAAVAVALRTPGPPALRPWKLGLIPVAVFFGVVSFFDPHAQPFPAVVVLLWSGVALGSVPIPSRAGGQRAPIKPSTGGVGLASA